MTGRWFTFQAGGRWFALDAAQVTEVAQAVPLTRLPFAPPHVEGIANVGGRILPQVDPAAYPALAPAAGEPGGREAGALLLVVRSRRGLLALRINRVGGTLAAGAIPLASPDAGPDAAGLPVVARFAAEGHDHLVLDPGRIEIGHGMGFAALPSDGVLVGGPAERSDPRGRNPHRFLVVDAGGQTVALGMDGLILVTPVDGLRALPGAPAVVRGVAHVRRRPVLLADPLAAAGPAANGHAVVFATRCGPVGLLVDAVRGVMRFADEAVKRTETPANGPPAEAVAHDGRWLDVRSGTDMLNDHMDRIGRLVPAAAGHPENGDHLRLRRTRRFLTFTAAGRSYALEFERVRRVVEAGSRQRLPGDGLRFDGITDVDGAILPIIDLRRVLAGAPPSVPAPPGIAILVEVAGGTVAVLADEVQRLRKVDEEDIDPMSDALTAAVIQLDGRLVPVLRPEGLMTPQPPSLTPINDGRGP